MCSTFRRFHPPRRRHCPLAYPPSGFENKHGIPLRRTAEAKPGSGVTSNTREVRRRAETYARSAFSRTFMSGRFTAVVCAATLRGWVIRAFLNSKRQSIGWLPREKLSFARPPLFYLPIYLTYPVLSTHELLSSSRKGIYRTAGALSYEPA